MPKLFISYRRADSQTFTERIHDRLATAFGEDSVFQDVDSIRMGADFRVALRQAVESCDIVLVMIGSQWATLTDEQGRKRLMNPADFVRIEVESALDSQKIVIPVVVEGATMPTTEDLPSSMHELLFRNAAKIRHNPDFNRDMQRLIEQIQLHDVDITQQRVTKEAERQRQIELDAEAKANAEEAERQRQAEIIARIQAEADERKRQLEEAEEKERQLQADLAAWTQAEAAERERKRLADEEAEQQRQAELEAQAKAEADERERQRLVEEQAEYEEKARLHRAEMLAAEQAHQSPVTTSEEVDLTPAPEPEPLPPLSEDEMETLKDQPVVGTQSAWQRFINSRRALVITGLLAVIFIIGIVASMNTSQPPTKISNTQAGKTQVTSAPIQNPTTAPSSGNQPTPVTSNKWNVVEQDFGGVKMVKVPAGCFDMGSDSQAYDITTTGVPSGGHICFNSVFWIDKTEVTNAQFTQFGGKAASSSQWTDADRPREHIDWFEARDFCLLRGARLPTEAEWEFAARGPDELAYPWGSPLTSDKAVYNTSQTATVGSKPSGASWVGAWDMSGNVYELVATLNLPYPYPTLGSTTELGQWINNDDSKNLRTIRGGSFSDKNLGTLRSAYRGTLYPDNNRSNNVGFRCARSDSS